MYFLLNFKPLTAALLLFCGTLQEISSLVGEVRAEASEAETVTMVAAVAAEGEEPMQTDMEQPSAASVLQVHVDAGEAAAAQVDPTHGCTCTRTAKKLEVTNLLAPLSDGDLRAWWAAPRAHVNRRGGRGGGTWDHHPNGDRPDFRPAGCRHVGRRGCSASDDTGGVAGRRTRR